MFRYFVLYSVFLFPLLSFGDFNPVKYKSLIDSSIQLTLKQDYKVAIEFLEKEAKSSPANPLVPLNLMLVYEAKMIDYETSLWKSEFDSLGLLAEKGFKKLLKKEPDNGWVHYYLGMLYVTRGAHEIRFSNYLKFTSEILRGIKYLNKSVSIDSIIYDAYVYIGAFEFAKANLIKWIPLIDDGVEEAIELIEKAKERSLFSCEVSEQILITLYGHIGELDKCSTVAKDFKERYPENRAIYWLFGNVLLSKKEYKRAYSEFKELKLKVQSIPVKFEYNYISVDANLAKILFHLERYEECVEICSKILLVKTDDKRVESFKKFARKYSKKAKKRLKKVL